MFQLHRKPVVVVYVRHRGNCPHREDESYPRCDCSKWLRFSLRGTQHRRSAGTRTWGVAEQKARELQKQLDAGEVAPDQTKPSAQPTITASIQTFITGKEGEGVGPATISKLHHQFGVLEKFLSARSRFFPSEITTTDVIEYRASWSGWKSAITRQITR